MVLNHGADEIQPATGFDSEHGYILWILNHMNDLYVKYLQVRGNFFCTLKSYHVLSQNNGFENNRPEFQSEIGY